MTEKPIIFTADAVRAILSGAKSVTRRVVKPQPVKGNPEPFGWFGEGVPTGADSADHGLYCKTPRGLILVATCPYKIGSRLWVREMWAIDACAYGDTTDQRNVLYRANGDKCRDGGPVDRWSSPIHMPRWASRLTLEITGVRVERLQDMSFTDWVRDFCPTENDKGLALSTFSGFSHQQAMARCQWDSVNKANPWRSNPWVWVLEFKVTT